MAQEPNPQLATLLPKLGHWNNGGAITADDWLNIFGSVPHAIAYSTLFWPEFMEYEGCLLWKEEHDLANFEAWIVKFDGNKTNVEGMLNHVHIIDFFPEAEEDPTPEQVEYLGRLLQKIWTLKLQNDFPLSSVRVEFYWHAPQDLLDAQITVYCQREEAS